MRKIQTVILGMMALGSSAAWGQSAPMNDDSVVAMLKAGFGPDVVVAKIKTSTTAFDVSDSKLIELKSAGVPDAVMAAMIAAGANAAGVSTDSPDPAAKHKPGIYALDDWDSSVHMVAIESQTSKNIKTSNTVGAALLGPLISPMHLQASFDGATAKLQAKTATPVFYFYFDPNVSDMSSVDNAISSPSDFSLVRYQVKDNSRIITVGKFAGIAGSDRGISKKEQVDFTSSQISPYVYKITFKTPLAPGEYGFIIGKGEAANALKAYAFSVAPR